MIEDLSAGPSPWDGSACEPAKRPVRFPCRRRRIPWRSLALLAGMGVPGIASALTVSDMVDGCTVAAGQSSDLGATSDATYCLGVADALAELLRFSCMSRTVEGSDPLPGLTASLPPSGPAAVRAIVDWMRANADSGGEDFVASCILAASGTFPCREAPSGP